MKVGTKSVLFGAHCFLIHPWFVAAAWTKLYGFPKDWHLWASFVLHDLGYWGLPNMDGAEGETHVEWGAKNLAFLHVLFTNPRLGVGTPDERRARFASIMAEAKGWEEFSLYHSRFYAKRDGKPHSRLCVADKLACCMEPWWLYLPRVWASGELWEYMAKAGGMVGSKYNSEPEVGKYASMNIVNNDPNLSTYAKVRHWHLRMTDYLNKWVEAHKDGSLDTWTPSAVGTGLAATGDKQS